MKKGEIIKEYLVKYPDTPTLTLAKIIYKKNKLLWGNVENVRYGINYYRGNAGDKKRNELKDKSHAGFEGKLNPFDALPEPMKHLGEWESYKIHGRNILLLMDLHIPYYVKPETILTLKYAQHRPPDTILLNGDIIDFYECSFWIKDPNKRKMLGEIRDLLKLLKYLREIFPKAKIIYKLGNHEERLENYIRIKAPELIEGEEEDVKDDPILTDVTIVKSFRNIIKANKLGIIVVPKKRVIKAGKYLHIIHGHEFGAGVTVPVNPARTLFLKAKDIALCGHHHRTSQNTVRTIGERDIPCWSVGGLCDLHPEFMPINEWNHGFAYIELDGDSFEVENKRIVKGKIYNN